MSKRMMGNTMLLLGAMIWGAAFVAQSVGMEYVEPFTFQACRCLLGSLVLLPVIAVLDRRGNEKKPVSPADRKFLLLSGLGCGVLYYGAHHDDWAGNAYPDCSPEFVQAMADAIERGTGGQLRLEAPFVSWNKARIVERGLALGVPYELTWSCYEGGDRPCGSCGTCIDRIAAFEANGVTDPLLG